MYRLFAIFLVVIAGTLPASSQSVALRKERAIDLFKRGENAAAVAELREIEASEPAAFHAENLDYLLANAAERSGSWAVATSAYTQVATRSGPFRPYALMHLSAITRATGNSLLERTYLIQLAAAIRSTPLASGAVSRLARVNLETSNFSEARRWLSGPTDQNTNVDAMLQRDDQTLLAETMVRAGDETAARPILTRLLDSAPKADQPDDASMLAAKMLDQIDGAAPLSIADHLKRATIFQYNREFADARVHYEAVIAAEPNGLSSADAAFQIGRGYAQVYEFVEAIKWYERVLERYSTAPVSRDALLQLAGAYSRVGKIKEAKHRYQQFIESYPTDEKLDRAYLNLVQVNRDLGEDQDALKWAAKAEDVFRGKPPATLATFSVALIHVARNEWLDAIVAIDRLAQTPDLGSTLPGGTTRPELNFLRAYCLEQAGRSSEAIEGYLAIPDGRDEYYGWRATERLRVMQSDDQVRSFSSQRIGQLAAALETKNSDDRRRAAQSLLRFETTPEVRKKALENLREALRQLPHYAIPAIAASTPNISPAGRIMDELGLTSEAVIEGAPSLQSRLAAAEAAWKKMPADFPVELMPTEHLERLFPAPYRDDFLRYAKPRGVDPRMMLSIMRQESRFQADAKSNAAARGLMQFIATTSNKIALRLDRSVFTQDELFYPATAIDFGSQYISELNTMFPNEPDAIAAAYNGGEDNVKRWLTRSRTNVPERYVPEVVFSQSKDYAFRVMNGFRMYQRIYDADLRPLAGR